VPLPLPPAVPPVDEPLPLPPTTYVLPIGACVPVLLITDTSMGVGQSALVESGGQSHTMTPIVPSRFVTVGVTPSALDVLTLSALTSALDTVHSTTWPIGTSAFAHDQAGCSGSFDAAEQAAEARAASAPKSTRCLLRVMCMTPDDASGVPRHMERAMTWGSPRDHDRGPPRFVRVFSTAFSSDHQWSVARPDRDGLIEW